MSLLFNMLSRFVITFLPRSSVFYFHDCSHHLQWFWSPPKQSRPLFSLFPHLFAHDVMGPDAMTLVFLMLSFKPTHSSQTIPKFRRGRTISQFIVLSPVSPWFQKKSQENYRPLDSLVSLMNIDAEIHSEILANKIQATCKKDIPRSHRIIHNHNPEMQGWFSIWESINFWYYANRIKGRNHIITSTDTVKVFGRFWNPFSDKNVQQIRSVPKVW